MEFLTLLAQSGTNVIEDLWDGLTTTISNVIDFFASLFESIVKIFWTSGTNGGLTVMGWLLLISIGVGLFWLAFKMIRRLIKMRG